MLYNLGSAVSRSERQPKRASEAQMERISERDFLWLRLAFDEEAKAALHKTGDGAADCWLIYNLSRDVTFSDTDYLLSPCEASVFSLLLLLKHNA